MPESNLIAIDMDGAASAQQAAQQSVTDETDLILEKAKDVLRSNLVQYFLSLPERMEVANKLAGGKRRRQEARGAIACRVYLDKSQTVAVLSPETGTSQDRGVIVGENPEGYYIPMKKKCRPAQNHKVDDIDISILADALSDAFDDCDSPLRDSAREFTLLQFRLFVLIKEIEEAVFAHTTMAPVFDDPTVTAGDRRLICQKVASRKAIRSSILAMDTDPAAIVISDTPQNISWEFNSLLHPLKARWKFNILIDADLHFDRHDVNVNELFIAQGGNTICAQ